MCRARSRDLLSVYEQGSMSKTAVIVQARLGSSRLPAKVLLPLPTGRTVLEEVLHRCKQIEGVDLVCCAVPTDSSGILAQYRKSADVFTICNFPENDVLARYAHVAELVHADIVMRITADCPLLDPEVCGRVLKAYLIGGWPFVCNNAPRTYPHGFDCEVFGAALLREANEVATSPEDREHVTPYMRREKSLLNIASAVDRSHLRWTLDTLSDYVTIWNQLNDARSNPLAA